MSDVREIKGAPPSATHQSTLLRSSRQQPGKEIKLLLIIIKKHIGSQLGFAVTDDCARGL